MVFVDGKIDGVVMQQHQYDVNDTAHFFLIWLY